MRVEKRRMLNSARITCDFLDLKAGDSALLCLPLDYIAGKMMMVRSIERNLKLHTVSPNNHPLAGGNLPTTEFDLIAMVPSQVYCSLQVPEERRILMQTRHIIIGGGAISSELERELSTFPNAVWSTYGMTETLSHIALRRLNGPSASAWYHPFSSVSIKQDSDGCLIIDAPLVHDGQLVTNDIVVINEQNDFRIIGRKDNVVCCGGVKLHIEQIEEKLRPYASGDFCITKRPDPKFGEVLVLLTTRQATDWSQVFSSALTPYEVPKDVCVVDEVPLTRTGKINRKAAIDIARGIESGGER